MYPCVCVCVHIHLCVSRIAPPYTSAGSVGRYKDRPSHGLVTPACPPRVGTLLRNADDLAKSGDAVAYAAAKLVILRLDFRLLDCTILDY